MDAGVWDEKVEHVSGVKKDAYLLDY